MAGPLVVWGESHALVLAPITHAMEMNLVWDAQSQTYVQFFFLSIIPILVTVSLSKEVSQLTTL